MEGIVANLRAAGLCAERDPDDGAQETIRVKSENDFSEDYDTLLSSGHMRRGEGAYRQSCTPASFPRRARGGRASDRQRLRPTLPARGHALQLQGAHQGPRVLHARLDADRRTRRRVLRGDRLHRRSLALPGARRRAPRTATRARTGASGKAQDTGRPGPTWRKADGSFCTGPASGCQNHPDTQYSLWTYVPGTYTVSAENGASCSVSH